MVSVVLEGSGPGTGLGLNEDDAGAGTPEVDIVTGGVKASPTVTVSTKFDPAQIWPSGGAPMNEHAGGRSKAGVWSLMLLFEPCEALKPRPNSAKALHTRQRSSPP